MVGGAITWPVPRESVASSDRFFPATIPRCSPPRPRIPDWGPWDPARLEWADEAFVDMFVGTDPIHRKTRTREELEAVVAEPRGVSPTREIWLHESLVMTPAGCGSRWSPNCAQVRVPSQRWQLSSLVHLWFLLQLQQVLGIPELSL